MKLEQYLRNEINLHIRPLQIKNKCEVCGCQENLHLHHNYPFFKIVDDVLAILNLEMKDTEEYTEQELYLIKSCVLAEHLKDNYKTLCQDCHIKEHEENKQRRKMYNQKYSERKKLERRKAKEERLNQIKVEEINRRKQLLDSVVGVPLSTKQFRELAVELDFRNKERHTIKKPYKEIESLGYKIIDKKTGNKRYKIISK